MKPPVFFLVCLCILMSCVERIDLPIRSENGILVVDGTITNAPPPYRVKLTYSGVFEYATRPNADQIESRATLSLSDDTGRTTAFTYVGEGNYQTSDLSFRGTVGRSYTLSIGLPDG